MGTESDEEILSDRVFLEEAIARYFKDIYKRPDHLQALQEEGEEMKGDDEELDM